MDIVVLVNLCILGFDLILLGVFIGINIMYWGI